MLVTSIMTSSAKFTRPRVAAAALANDSSTTSCASVLLALIILSKALLLAYTRAGDRLSNRRDRRLTAPAFRKHSISFTKLTCYILNAQKI